MAIRRSAPPPPVNPPRSRSVPVMSFASEEISTGLTDFGDDCHIIDRISDDELVRFDVVQRLRENRPFYSVSNEQIREGGCYYLSTRRWPRIYSIAFRTLSQKAGEGHHRIPGENPAGACALHCGLTRLRRNPIVDATDRAQARFRLHNAEVKGSIVSLIEGSMRQSHLDLSLAGEPKRVALKIPRELGVEVVKVSQKLGLNIDTIGLMSIALCLTTQAGVNKEHRADMKVVCDKFLDSLVGRLAAYSGLMDQFGFEGGNGKVR
jgi:hypothetical protein